MRVDAAPFNDVRVAQAFRLIPDRPQLLDLVFGGYGLVANDLFSVWDPVYDSSIPQRTQDIDQAKFLLKQAGHEGMTIELVTADLAQGVISTAEVFAKQAAAAGVTVNLRQVSVTDFYGSNYLKWIFAQDYWYYDPYFPQVGLANLPTSGYNETHYENPQYLSLYAQALKTVDETKRKGIADEMQRLFFDTSGYIIPYFSPTIDGYSSKVGGVKESRLGVPFGFFNFKEMWLE
jgi:peptide/nickel transport system substrate-binding protein